MKLMMKVKNTKKYLKTNAHHEDGSGGKEAF